MNNASEIRHVLVIEDSKSRRIVSLSDQIYSIGRAPTNTIVLYDRQVSRHHVTLLRVNDDQNQHFSYRLIDGNSQGKRSTNGVMVNGEYCLAHELKPGDLIRFSNKSKATYNVITVSPESDLDGLRLGGGKKVAPVRSDFSESPPNVLEDPDLVNTSDLEKTGGADSLSGTVILPPSHARMDKDREKRFQNEKAYLNPSTSLVEYSPNPIIELSFAGKILYYNPAAIIEFPNLLREQTNHPILAGLLSLSPNQDSTSFVREIKIGKDCYEQHVYFSPDQQGIFCYVFDITKQYTLEVDYKLLHQDYQLYRQLTTEGIVVVDAESKAILEANPAYCQMLGYGETEITGLSLYQVVATAREIVDAQLQIAQEEETFFLEEVFHRAADGTLVGVSTNISSRILRGRTVYCFSVRDRRSHQKREGTLDYEQLHDPLTQLPNRTLLYQQLELALNHARHHQHLLAILFLHLDSLPLINHSLGHRSGDQSLQFFAEKVQDCLRSGDLVCHWGGATFCVLLPSIKNTEDTIKLTERIFTNLETPVIIEHQTFTLSSHIGIAIYPQDGEMSDLLLRNADLALSRIRAEGSGHYQFFNPQFSEEACLQLRIERLLQQAIARKQLAVVYQPQVNLQNGKITGMEALLRWEHPEVNYLSPAKFIPLAAKTNLIFEIGQWVLKTACQQNLLWQKEGLPPFPIAVNLTSQEFYQNSLAIMVAKVLTEIGLDPHWLELDITEKTLRLNPYMAKKILKDLTDLGVRIALDDFGRGYASFGLLQHFPLRTLKLDQRFIRDLRGTAQESGLISAITTLGKGFNLRIVAEGVETEEQLEILRHLQCEEIQGYCFSRPLKVKEATQFLHQQFST